MSISTICHTRVGGYPSYKAPDNFSIKNVGNNEDDGFPLSRE